MRSKLKLFLKCLRQVVEHVKQNRKRANAKVASVRPDFEPTRGVISEQSHSDAIVAPYKHLALLCNSLAGLQM
jgi:hypothetical protein